MCFCFCTVITVGSDKKHRLENTPNDEKKKNCSPDRRVLQRLAERAGGVKTPLQSANSSFSLLHETLRKLRSKGGNDIPHLVQNDTFSQKHTVGNDSPNDKALNHRPEQGVHVELSGSYCSSNEVFLHQVCRSAASHHRHMVTMTINPTATKV